MNRIKRNLCVIISSLLIFTGCSGNVSTPPLQNAGDNIPIPPESFVALSLEAQSPILHNTVAMTGSGYHVMAIQTDGGAWFWGGQYEENHLGDTAEHLNTPVKVMEGATAVSVESTHQSILLEDGTLWNWGENNRGEIGDGTFESRHAPVQVLEYVQTMKTGGGNCVALLEDGSLYYWGSYTYISVISALTPNGTPENIVPHPEPVLEQVTHFEVWGGTMLAIREDNSLWGWSLNDHGQLGLGHKYEVPVGKAIKLKENVQNMWPGSDTVYVLDQDGTLWGAGRNNYGMLGRESDFNYDVAHFTPMLKNVVDFEMGDFHCTALTADGRMWTWGDNRQGQLGIGKETMDETDTPVCVMDQVIKVYAHSDYTAAIRQDGSLWVWGESFDNLIERDFATPDLPTKIAEDVHSAYIGLGVIIFLKDDGTLWGIGDNDTGQLADGTFENRSQPVLIMENVRLPE